jgi:thioredoxin reductase (NADPH)
MDVSLVIYAIPLALFTGIYIWRQRRTQRRHLLALQDSVSSGMTEPASLHPLINDSKCLGCGACVKACPETSHHDVLASSTAKRY